jgi:xylulose-5-phosphate/fructose-6-phosphate phosphoketolase
MIPEDPTSQSPVSLDLGAGDVEALDLWRRAANYSLSDRSTCWKTHCSWETLRAGHVKPRLLGHWGRRPGSTSWTRT